MQRDETILGNMMVEEEIMITYIGIDVSKATLELYDGNERKRVENSREACAEYLSLMTAKGSVRLIYEATGPYSLLLDLLSSEMGIEVYRVNPRESKHFFHAVKQRIKTDAMDASVLWQMHKLISEEQFSVIAIDKSLARLEELYSYYDFLQREIVTYKNRLESQSYKVDPWIVGDIQNGLKILEDRQEAVLAQMDKLIETNDDLSKKRKAIESIKGISRKSSLILTLFFLKYPPMNRSELSALSGLDPVETTSGTSVRKKSRISKRGLKLLRKILFMPTLVISYKNRALREYYRRLVERGKNKKAAIIALMRKIIIIAYSIFKSGESFDEERYLKNFAGQNG
jgi:transposase